MALAFGSARPLRKNLLQALIGDSRAAAVVWRAELAGSLLARWGAELYAVRSDRDPGRLRRRRDRVSWLHDRTGLIPEPPSEAVHDPRSSTGRIGPGRHRRATVSVGRRPRRAIAEGLQRPPGVEDESNRHDGHAGAPKAVTLRSVVSDRYKAFRVAGTPSLGCLTQDRTWRHPRPCDRSPRSGRQLIPFTSTPSGRGAHRAEAPVNRQRGEQEIPMTHVSPPDLSTPPRRALAAAIPAQAPAIAISTQAGAEGARRRPDPQITKQAAARARLPPDLDRLCRQGRVADVLQEPRSAGWPARQTQGADGNRRQNTGTALSPTTRRRPIRAPTQASPTSSRPVERHEYRAATSGREGGRAKALIARSRAARSSRTGEGEFEGPRIGRERRDLESRARWSSRSSRRRGEAEEGR